MGVSKVELSNGETLVDLTKDTVTAETLGEGATAHNSKGEEIVGTMKSGDMLKSVYDTDNDGKVDTANNSEKLDGLTHMDIVSESVAFTGTLPRGICDENGVISPDEPWFEFDEESNIQIGKVTPNAYDFIWFASFTSHIILSVKADIEPVDGKLPLKIKANFFRIEIPSTIIDVPANSPLKADKTYHFIVDSRYAEVIETEDGFKVTGLKGAIIGLDPETDTVPTEDSTNLITSGAVYDVLGDINSILDNINGEVV